MEDKLRTAVVAGASGLVGSELVRLLLENPHYEKITLLARKDIERQNEKLAIRTIDFDRLTNEIRDLQSSDVFCCLGTTMKKAGSREAFKKVDLDYVVDLARQMCRNGSRRFLVVSSIGASRKSRFFYLRVKGEMEEVIKNIPFPVIHIFRPSLLLGNRKERRVGEKIAIFFYSVFGFLFVGSLRRHKGIEAAIVARAMVNTALSRGDGIFTYESEMIRKM